MPQVRMTMAKRRRMWNKAILALMTCPTVDAAADAIDVHPNTLENWLHEESFLEMLQKAQDDALGLGIIKLNLRINETIDTLHSIVMDAENPAAVRVAAASKELEIITRTIAARTQANTVKQLTDEIDALKKAREETEAENRARTIDGEVVAPKETKRSWSDGGAAALVASNRSEEDEGEDQGD